MKFPGKWVDMETVILSEYQTQKDRCCMFSHLLMLALNLQIYVCSIWNFHGNQEGLVRALGMRTFKIGLFSGIKGSSEHSGS